MIDANEMMDVETVSSNEIEPRFAGNDATATTSNASFAVNDDDLFVTLIDAIPCNLRNVSKFLASRIEVTLSKRNLRLFLQCYGFLMHDKTNKLAVLRANDDPRVREIADVLNECKTLADFKVLMRAQLAHVNDIISDPGALDALVNDSTIDCPIKRREQKQSGLDILNMAKYALEYVCNFVQNSDHLRRALNANEYCRQELLRDIDRKYSLPSVYDAWHNSTTCDFDECLSIIFRDAIVTTGMQTHSVMLFVVRASLILTYLMTNFVCQPNNRIDDCDGDNRGGDNRDASSTRTSSARITVTIPRMDDANDEAAATDFWTNYNEITVEKFVATVMISMFRMFVAECVEWPVRIRESAQRPNSAISLEKMWSIITTQIASRQTDQRDRALPWLRVMRSRNRANANASEKRFYVNFDAVLKLFQELSVCVRNNNSTSSNVASATSDDDPAAFAAATDVSANSVSAALDPNGHAPIRVTDRRVRDAWCEYENDSLMCANAIVQSLNRSATEAPESANVCSMERFVTKCDSAYRDSSDDFIGAVAAGGSKSPTLDGSISDNAPKRRNDADDEIDLLSGDIGAMLMFAVLSLIRHDVKSKEYVSLIDQTFDPTKLMFNDELNESHKILMIGAMSHLYRTKMSLSQVRELLTYLVHMWHSHLGIVSLEQFSEILFTMYRMFPVNANQRHDTRDD